MFVAPGDFLSTVMDLNLGVEVKVLSLVVDSIGFLVIIRIANHLSVHIVHITDVSNQHLCLPTLDSKSHGVPCQHPLRIRYVFILDHMIKFSTVHLPKASCSRWML